MDIWQESWAIRAFLASSMVGIMCGVLGAFIVLRNMSLIGDALAHAILPGVVVAFILVGQSAIGLFTGAVAASLITAVVITWIQQKVNTKNDAAIGIVFTAMFSLGVIGISSINRKPGVHIDLKDFLFGNILGVSTEDLYLILIILIYVLASVVLLYRYLFATTFQPIIARTMGISVQTVHYFLMLLLAFAVVASLRTVGVILVVAMLITPASTALLLSKRLERIVVISALLGLTSAVLGLFIAIVLDTTPGPAMALVATLFYFLAVMFAPEKGLIWKATRKRQLKRRIRWEDFMKTTYRLQEENELNLAMLSEKMSYTQAQTQRHVQALRSNGFFENEKLSLSEKGKNTAQQLIRAHRLWETYLVEQLGLSQDQIHEEAEQIEHFLTDELLDEVDERLGYPTKDPHGSPIPSKIALTISQLPIAQKAVITHEQVNNTVTAKLWDLGLMPDIPIALKEKVNGSFAIEQDNRIVTIPSELANTVSVRRFYDDETLN
jgi:ABC-type Mn2+/Zn2+ transport system permease subunit/Mn-dependent DtxR family transcriptional regulator